MRLRNAGRRRQASSPIVALTEVFEPRQLLAAAVVAEAIADRFENQNLRDANGYGLNVDVLPRFEYRATNKLTGEVVTLDDANFIRSPNIVFDNFGDFIGSRELIDDGRFAGYLAVDATSLTQSLVESLPQGIFGIEVRVQHIPVVGPGKARSWRCHSVLQQAKTHRESASRHLPGRIGQNPQTLSSLRRDSLFCPS